VSFAITGEGMLEGGGGIYIWGHLAAGPRDLPGTGSFVLA
jgi:hypothetical protein